MAQTSTALRPASRTRGIPPFEATLAVLALAVFGAMAAVVTGGLADPLDTSLYAALRQVATPTLDLVAHVLSIFGSEAVGVVHLILLVVFVRRKQYAIAAGLFLATAGAGLLNGMVKDVFARDRPAEVYGLMPVTAGQVYSFPSGHAMVSAAFCTYLAYVTCPALDGWRRRGWIAALLALLVVVGTVRTYLGAHYLTDVLAGYVIGFGWAYLVIVVAHLLGWGDGLRCLARPANPPQPAGSPAGAGSGATAAGVRSAG